MSRILMTPEETRPAGGPDWSASRDGDSRAPRGAADSARLRRAIWSPYQRLPVLHGVARFDAGARQPATSGAPALRRAVAGLLLVLVLAACGGPAPPPDISGSSPTRAGDLAPTGTPPAPTSTPEPTAPPVPTATPPAPAETPTAAPTTSPPSPLVPTLTPTRAAAVPTITREQAVGQFPRVSDPRAIGQDPGSFVDQKVVFVGEIVILRVARAKEIYAIGEYRTHAVLQVKLAAPDTLAGDLTVVVLYDGDTSALAEKARVTVYAIGKGQHNFERAAGGTLSQPLFYAQYIDVEG